jgi:hypothetical protein
VVTESAPREVLEHQPRQWRPSHRAKVGLAVLATVLTVAVVVDHRASQSELVGLDRCASQIDSSTSSAFAPVTAMANYVRPARDGATPALASDLDRMISAKAESAAATLAPAYDECQAVRVLWHHWAASDRKAQCLAQLDAAAAYFELVRVDGGTVFRAGEPRETRC